MASSPRRVPHVSPRGKSTIFPGQTQVPAAQSVRDHFLNDLAPVSIRTAIELFELLSALHEAARLDFHLRERQAKVAGKKRPYGGKRGSYRKVEPAHIPSRRFTGRQLALIKWHWPEIYPLPEVVTKPADPVQVAKGIATMQAAVYGLLSDGMFPAERKIKAMIDTELGISRSRPADEQALRTLSQLSANERYGAIHAYYQHREAGKSTTEAAAHFIPLQARWRKRQSFHACKILSFVENELANPRYFSKRQLRMLEVRYHADALPPFPGYRHITSRTARLAIAIEASVQVRLNSQILRLDLVLARHIAKKFNAFLSSKISPTPMASYSRLI